MRVPYTYLVQSKANFQSNSLYFAPQLKSYASLCWEFQMHEISTDSVAVLVFSTVVNPQHLRGRPLPRRLGKPLFRHQRRNQVFMILGSLGIPLIHMPLAQISRKPSTISIPLPLILSSLRRLRVRRDRYQTKTLTLRYPLMYTIARQTLAFHYRL